MCRSFTSTPRRLPHWQRENISPPYANMQNLSHVNWLSHHRHLNRTFFGRKLILNRFTSRHLILFDKQILFYYSPTKYFIFTHITTPYKCVLNCVSIHCWKKTPLRLNWTVQYSGLLPIMKSHLINLCCHCYLNQTNVKVQPRVPLPTVSGFDQCIKYLISAKNTYYTIGSAK